MTTMENRLVSAHLVFVTISSIPTFYGESQKLSDYSNGNDDTDDDAHDDA